MGIVLLSPSMHVLEKLSLEANPLHVVQAVTKTLEVTAWSICSWKEKLPLSSFPPDHLDTSRITHASLCFADGSYHVYD